MWLDARSLEAFYATPWGALVGDSLAGYVQTLWGSLAQQHLLAVGYPLPVLDRLDPKPEQCFVALPQRMGHVSWPAEPLHETPEARAHRCNRTLMIKGGALPFRDSSLDRILLLHQMEFSHDIPALTSELYRVLHDQGEVLMIVPNRAGLWSRSERSPFGYGQPFTPGQINGQLKGAGFETFTLHGGLYFPPRNSRLVRRHARRWDQLGGRWAKLVAGVLIVQARKAKARRPRKVEHQDALRRIRGLLADVPLRPEGLRPEPSPLVVRPLPRLDHRQVDSKQR
jgi:SAM-dependent methyltransferase